LQHLLSTAKSLDELQKTLSKFRDESFGRIGVLQDTVKKLQAERAATPAGEPIDVTEQDLDELAKAYPEMTKDLVTGLKRVVGKLKGTAPVVAEPIDFDARVNPLVDARVAPIVEARVQAIERKFEAKLLTSLHPDWETVVGPKDSTTEFRAWLHLKGPLEEARVLDSWDGLDLAKSINQFKTEIKKSKPAAPKATANGTDTRSQRLAEASVPKGSGGLPPQPRKKTPEEEFQEGYAGAHN
jgi:hypothetical protein